MELVFKPELAAEACGTVQGILDNVVLDAISAVYTPCVEASSDNPLVEGLTHDFKAIEAFYNNELVPLANKVKANFEGYGELSQYFLSLNTGSAVQTADLGSVADANYDAAMNL